MHLKNLTVKIRLILDQLLVSAIDKNLCLKHYYFWLQLRLQILHMVNQAIRGQQRYIFFVFFRMYHYSLELYKKYLIIGFVNEGSREVGRGWGGFLSLRNLFPILTTGTQSPSSFRGSCPSVAKDKYKYKSNVNTNTNMLCLGNWIRCSFRIFDALWSTTLLFVWVMWVFVKYEENLFPFCFWPSSILVQSPVWSESLNFSIFESRTNGKSHS